MIERIELRPASDEDRPFLLSVYASSREEELSQVEWLPGTREAFLEAQFDAQHLHYREKYPNAEYLVIFDGEVPVGRLYVVRLETRIHVIDIALLADARGEGIGSSILTDLGREAARTGRRVTIYVEKFNPAKRLYSRLGFVPVEDGPVYEFMEWQPEVALS